MPPQVSIKELKDCVVISAQPQAQTVAAGASATLSVTATGGPSGLNYQWRKNGVTIIGARSSSYPITAQAIDAGSYTVLISNAAGSLTSSAATLTVNGPLNVPTITTQPANLTVTVGASDRQCHGHWQRTIELPVAQGWGGFVGSQ